MCAVIAVHGNRGFAGRWRDTAAALGHEVRAVDGYASDIVPRLRGCDAFLWHLSQDERRDLEHARAVLLAAERSGLRVFPNHATCSHFDDKIAQKYLLEAIGAPLAPTWAFYEPGQALAFLEGASYPLVFKLRRGAGSLNVRLVRDRREGARLVARMFGRGIRPFSPGKRLAGVARRAAVRTSGGAGLGLRERVSRVLRRWLEQSFRTPRERGYVLFQKFVPDNDHDIRVTVIGKRAFAFLRGNRPDDFRASGSGRIRYPERSEVPDEPARIAFEISRRLGFQAMAYDFVVDRELGGPVVLEMSYVFLSSAVAACGGYTDPSGGWRDERRPPEDLILEDLLGSEIA